MKHDHAYAKHGLKSHHVAPGEAALLAGAKKGEKGARPWTTAGTHHGAFGGVGIGEATHSGGGAHEHTSAQAEHNEVVSGRTGKLGAAMKIAPRGDLD